MVLGDEHGIRLVHTTLHSVFEPQALEGTNVAYGDGLKARRASEALHVINAATTSVRFMHSTVGI